MLIQLVLIDYVDLYLEDVSTFMRGHQAFICISCCCIVGAFGSTEWIIGAFSRLVFTVTQLAIIQNKRLAEEDGTFNVYLHCIFVLILLIFAEVHFYLIMRQ